MFDDPCYTNFRGLGYKLKFITLAAPEEVNSVLNTNLQLLSTYLKTHDETTCNEVEKLRDKEEFKDLNNISDKYLKEPLNKLTDHDLRKYNLSQFYSESFEKDPLSYFKYFEHIVRNDTEKNFLKTFPEDVQSILLDNLEKFKEFNKARLEYENRQRQALESFSDELWSELLEKDAVKSYIEKNPQGKAFLFTKDISDDCFNQNHSFPACNFYMNCSQAVFDNVLKDRLSEKCISELSTTLLKGLGICGIIALIFAAGVRLYRWFKKPKTMNFKNLFNQDWSMQVGKFQILPTCSKKICLV